MFKSMVLTYNLYHVLSSTNNHFCIQNFKHVLFMVGKFVSFLTQIFLPESNYYFSLDYLKTTIKFFYQVHGQSMPVKCGYLFYLSSTPTTRKDQKRQFKKNYLLFCCIGCTLFIWCCWKTLEADSCQSSPFSAQPTRKRHRTSPKGKLDSDFTSWQIIKLTFEPRTISWGLPV